jgi:hypothetical protein
MRTAAVAASADWLLALVPRLHAYALDIPAGCQTYPVRALIVQDFPGTHELVFQLLDPKLVKYQFPCSTITKGFDPVVYFTKYPGHRPEFRPRPQPPAGGSG